MLKVQDLSEASDRQRLTRVFKGGVIMDVINAEQVSFSLAYENGY